MIYLVLNGGLGNQLFQIAMAYAVGMKNEFNVSTVTLSKLSLWRILRGLEYVGDRSTYWSTFFESLQEYLVDEVSEKSKVITYHETDYGLEVAVPELEDGVDVLIQGYFQSYHYVDPYKDQFFNLLGISGWQEKARYKYQDVDFNTGIVIHFRLGDYLTNSHNYLVLPIEYYIKSIKWITSMVRNGIGSDGDGVGSDGVGVGSDGVGQSNCDKTVNVYYVVDPKSLVEADELIMKLECKLSQGGVDCQFNHLSGESDYEEMILMSLFGAIVTANSTFSWWGAYLSNALGHGTLESKKPLITVPGNWFGPGLKHLPVKGFHYPGWKVI